MSRIDRTMLKGLSGATSAHPVRSYLDGVLNVRVLSDDTVFESVVEQMHALYNVNWNALHQAEFPVSVSELTKYIYTALRARIARVNNERFHTRCDDTWAVPTPFAAALAGLGRVDIENPLVQIVPVWNMDYDEMVLTRDDTLRITQRLRVCEKDPDAKLLFAKAIAGDKQGDEVLMSLIPVRDAQGRVTDIHARNDLDPVAAFVYLLLGLDPQLPSAPVLPTHPLLMPASYVRVGALLHSANAFVEAGA